MSQRETNGAKSAKADRSAKKKTRRHAKKALITACTSAGLWTGTSNEALGSSQTTFFGSLKDVTTSTIQKWITELNSGHDRALHQDDQEHPRWYQGHRRQA
jgi:hypothetical protein